MLLDVLNEQVNLRVHQSRLSKLRNFHRSELNCPTISSLPCIARAGIILLPGNAGILWPYLLYHTSLWLDWELDPCDDDPDACRSRRVDHIDAGPVAEGHIEVGPVVAGHIEVSLCLLFPLYHTWSSSAQHICDDIYRIVWLVKLSWYNLTSLQPSQLVFKATIDLLAVDTILWRWLV